MLWLLRLVAHCFLDITDTAHGQRQPFFGTWPCCTRLSANYPDDVSCPVDYSTNVRNLIYIFFFSKEKNNNICTRPVCSLFICPFKMRNQAAQRVRMIIKSRFFKCAVHMCCLFFTPTQLRMITMQLCNILGFFRPLYVLVHWAYLCQNML